MKNSARRRRVRGEFANLGCGNRSVNASQPFDNSRDIWWAHQDSNLGPTDYERVSGSNNLQTKPTNSQRSLAHTETALGLSCSFSAGDFGEFSESPPGKALKQAAIAEKCDFPGFGPHSLRRANITWRQEVGGSSIEASRIAGHASTKITEGYTVVQLKRQEELTRRIQGRLDEAARKVKEKVEQVVVEIRVA